MTADHEPVSTFRVALVLGGARSGKSAYAERLALDTRARRVYVATAEAWDDEMRERIARHRFDRGPDWLTIEAPHDPVDAILANDDHESVILLDCLTLWLSNILVADRDETVERARLCRLLPKLRARIVLVSNETGMGVVPDNALARRFRDAQGRLNQAVAAVADRVVFVAAGLPLTLKP